VEFSVTDTGIGIAPQNLAHIFDMFCQGDRQKARSDEGVGLGLYIVRKYAELLGGSVRVESEPGRGSRFLVYLPIAPSASSNTSKSPPFH
jgi:signal transduction histidine kinase